MENPPIRKGLEASHRKMRLTIGLMVLIFVIGLVLLALFYRFARNLETSERKALADKAELIANMLAGSPNVKIAFFVGQSEQLFESTVEEIARDREIAYLVFISDDEDGKGRAEERSPFYAYFNESVLGCDRAALREPCRERDTRCHCADFPKLPDKGESNPTPTVSDFTISGLRCLDVAVPVIDRGSNDNSNRLIGWIRVGLSAHQMNDNRRSMNIGLVSLILGLAMLGGVIVALLSLKFPRSEVPRQ